MPDHLSVGPSAATSRDLACQIFLFLQELKESLLTDTDRNFLKEKSGRSTRGQKELKMALAQSLPGSDNKFSWKFFA